MSGGRKQSSDRILPLPAAIFTIYFSRHLTRMMPSMQDRKCTIGTGKLLGFPDLDSTVAQKSFIANKQHTRSLRNK